MKISTTYIVGLLGVLFLIGCQGSSSDSVRNDARRSIEQSRPNTPVTPPASTITPSSDLSTTTASNSGVQHYICPNNCEGSGGPGAGTCPVCGSEYTHNQAYHSQQASTTPTITTTPTPPSSGAITPTITPPAASGTGQNAAGVYHYTCSNGCEGGAGSAVACASCGTTLVHNSAYHQ